MLFMSNTFTFGSRVRILAHSSLDNALIRELWSGFTFTASEADIVSHDDPSVIIGSPEPQALDGHSCVTSVTAEGIYIAAKDSASLTDGFLSILSAIKPICLENGREELSLQTGLRYIDRPIERKAVHICVFPETSMFFLRRMVRLAGFLRYSHIVLEFWGTYRFKCLPELAWRERSFTADALKPIIDDAAALGVEIIPEFNHLGHASSSRSIYGKHTVLDQNPRLATLFSEDGWAWDLTNPSVRPLLKKVRAELSGLCGRGGFFHLGCDECYSYEGSPEKMSLAAGFIADICYETLSEGRRPIIWGDMLLTKERMRYSKDEPYECNCKSEAVAHELMSRLPKQTVIADWQYNIKSGVWRSTEYFMQNGFDTFVCPWEGRENLGSAVKTVKELKPFGLMETTWHHLPKMVRALLYLNYALEGDAPSDPLLCTETATLMRKLLPATNYEEAGWARTQLEFI